MIESSWVLIVSPLARITVSPLILTSISPVKGLGLSKGSTDVFQKECFNRPFETPLVLSLIRSVIVVQTPPLSLKEPLPTENP